MEIVYSIHVNDTQFPTTIDFSIIPKNLRTGSALFIAPVMQWRVQ